MSSPSTESHRLVRRDSSPRAARSSSRRRPRLLRACATEPSITTSSACKGVLTSPNSSRRATELLSRVAVNNAAVLSSSPNSTRSFGAVDYEGSGLTEAEKRELLRSDSNPYSVGYFSFPSFDTWDIEQQQEGKDVPP
ncbi:hypothetical protein BKA67DRAFT_674394 [Truncatella angustata]|uniref:Uncharacterized protein n=1 Tax=Truncatella angustata TaxID=152316 RepID=A0A9P9A2Y0_9PEZI|nr:uncharacterized protein BKA67DRAFT_674394 [Truncatella angustata]KAH6658385.1 hypothetical protein BKA67DRAFT_674394 [Truncatella angustata]